MASLIILFSAPYPDIIFDGLGTAGPTSLGFFLSTLAFPVLGVAGLVTAWRIEPQIAGRLARGYAATVSGALLVLAVYMASYGWLGLRTWNY